MVNNMTEREIADIQLKNKELKKKLEYKDWLLKQREQEIVQLKLLLHEKIKKKVRKWK